MTQKRKADDAATTTEALAHAARGAALKLATATGDDRTAALRRIHAALKQNADRIKAENKKDLDNAAKNNLSKQLIRRLDLSGTDKFDAMLQGVLDIAEMEDPVGKTSLATRLDTGLDLYRVSCPIGVVLIIFEARPEVVVNIAALTIKSGNAVILKGGKEAQYSNAILHQIISEALCENTQSSVTKDAVLLVESRTAIDTLLQMDRYIDLVIPRGSNALVRHVQGNTRIPVLGHADGICTTYLDQNLDQESALRILIDAKTTAPSACNATETLLIHSSHLLTPFFHTLLARLTLANISLRLDPPLFTYLTPLEKQNALITEATEEDFSTEFLDTILAVRAVPTLSAAIAHINSHGSHHTDAIITTSSENADAFLRSVDSADVFWNASTRFADGFRFGFGAEIGVSTNKTHARGPVGVEGLLIYKFRLHGNGQCSGDYGVGKKEYKHEKLEVEENKFQL
ncbi:hypothetical protein HDU79_006379 [Rhizoclosmatium sp. JEL0117]|nr:hypothetical protein HDU79_006379 [Rhizoclosmatium sp. JEL0117]